MIYLLMDTGAVSLLFYYKQYYNEHPTRLLVHFCQYLFRAWMHLEVELHITVYLYLQVPRFCQIAFQKGCDDLYSTSCTGRFCFLHILTDTWYCQIFSNCRLLMLWNGNIVLMESFALINIFFSDYKKEHLSMHIDHWCFFYDLSFKFIVNFPLYHFSLP